MTVSDQGSSQSSFSDRRYVWKWRVKLFLDMQCLKSGNKATHKTGLYVMTCRRTVCNSPKMGLCSHFGRSVKKQRNTGCNQKIMKNVQIYLHSPKQKAQAGKTQKIAAKIKTIIGPLLIYFFLFKILKFPRTTIYFFSFFLFFYKVFINTFQAGV